MSDDSQSQTLRAILGLRGMIIDGELPPGSRVSETVVVEALGVSRTPARMALVRVKDEGLLEQLPSGGFVVSSFTEGELLDAIEIRGTLEGMAARFAAERGAPSSVLGQMERCVADLDRVVSKLDDTLDLDDYMILNDRFHELLLEASGSAMVTRSLDRIKSLPFAAPNAFVKSSGSDSPQVKTILSVAQDQHRYILEAIRNRQGTRAQALAIEHSFSATKYLRLALESERSLENVPILRLLRLRTVG
ncbi:GntR family transcriptional regulator [Microvirga pudoricolor]|uniref:GntR family transcriptional regulator n=1 Tax=Microvirga pudoricolor TaxID=2778729 RepID=UPI00194F954C|nr:GntR family transcriptional regulator [Microvirga pudoricolor]MBM6593154.1 GntR family transcriptional regulator [Microvirga pudoricolor]